MRSGFGGFNKLSPSVGKSIAIDSYGNLETALQSILGNTNIQVFTTAVPSSITTIISGSTTVVSRWDSITNPTANCHLTQSTLASMPTFDSSKQLGKYNGVRSVVDDSLAQSATTVNSATHTYIIYGVHTSYAVSGEDYISSYWIEPAAPSQVIYGTPKISSYNAAAGNANIALATKTVALNLGYRAYSGFAGSAATTILPKTNYYRVFESRILPNRTGSMGIYDSNMNTINITNMGIVFPAGSATLLTSNKSYVTFSPSSYSASLAVNLFTNADWDSSFAGDTFRATRIGFLRSCVDASLFTAIFIPAVITANQSATIKTLLDKVYGA